MIGIDTDRSAAYDFLLTVHSNQGPYRTVGEINGDFCRKSQYFPTPVYFVPPPNTFPLELDTGAGGQKN